MLSPGGGEEYLSARGELATMLNVAYRNSLETEPDVPIENDFTPDLQLIVPNLHRRYSGVTATNRMVAPKARRYVPRRLARFRMPPTASRGWDLAIC